METTYQEIFEKIKTLLSKADTSSLNRDFAIQCNIEGEGEGAFYIANKEGVFSVEPYDYVDNDAQIFTSGDTYIKMFSKELSGIEAHEKGLLRFSGDVGAVLALGELKGKEEMAKTAEKEEIVTTEIDTTEGVTSIEEVVEVKENQAKKTGVKKTGSKKNNGKKTKKK